MQALQEQLQASSAVERRAAALEEETHSQKAELAAMRATMQEYERGAEEVQQAHQALQIKYEQGQTELAAAQVCHTWCPSPTETKPNVCGVQQQAEAAATQVLIVVALRALCL